MTGDESDGAILVLRDIYKSYGATPALQGASLAMRRAEVHALVGENGAGKSTLTKVIAGTTRPDRGNAAFKGKNLDFRRAMDAAAAGISIVYQEFNLLPDLSVAQNIFIGREAKSRIPGMISDRATETLARGLLGRLGQDIDPSRLVGSLTVAQQQMVEIAKALSWDCELLILDEPTAALTERETSALFDVIASLKSEGVALLYISHRLEELSAIADRVTVMRDGAFIAEHAISEVDHDQLVQEMVGRKIANQFPPRIDASIGEPALEVRGLSTKALLRDVGFTVREGEILGVAGLIGAGRTEMARAVFGADRRSMGDIALGGRRVDIRSPFDAVSRRIAYVTEDRKGDGLFLELSVAENLVSAARRILSSFGWISSGRSRRLVDSMIARLGVRSAGPQEPISTLSGGNQQKVVLAKWLATEPRVLILDEPTRGVDVGAKYEIYTIIRQLAAQGVAIVMISSDLPEIQGMSDRVLVMADGRVMGELDASTTDAESVARLAMRGKHT